MSYLRGMWEALGEQGLVGMLEVQMKMLAEPTPEEIQAEKPKHGHSEEHKTKKEKKHKRVSREDSLEEDDNEALFKAAEAGQAVILRELLANNADPNVCHETFGDTPLQMAAKNGHKEAVKALIEAGADLDMVTVVGASALMLSASHGHKKIVNLLLESKADTSSK